MTQLQTRQTLSVFFSTECHNTKRRHSQERARGKETHMALSSRTRVAGILTSGGDCPGLNAAIRGVVKPAISDFHIEVIGIEKGFRGLVENQSRVLHLQDVSNILAAGGTILGTSREKPHRMPLAHGKTVDLTNRAVETYHRLG